MARRKINEPVIESKVFSNVQEIEAGIEKLRRRIEDVRGLDTQKVRYNDQKGDNVQSNIKETIREVFGQYSPEFQEHQYHSIWDGEHRIGMSEMECQHNFFFGRGRF